MTTASASATAAARAIFTPAASCFTSPLALPATSSASTYGGTIFSVVTVGCPNANYLTHEISLDSALPTGCCGPFSQAAPAVSTGYLTAYAYTLPLMARAQLCPAGYVAKSVVTQNAETTAVCCPSGFTDGYGGSTYCSKSDTGTALASGTELITATNTVAFALVAVWNQRILSDLHTSISTYDPYAFPTASLSLGTGSSTGTQTIVTAGRNLAAIIGGIAAGVCVLVVLCIAACILCTRCRQRKKEKNAYTNYPPTPNGVAAATQMKEPPKTPIANVYAPQTPTNYPPELGIAAPHELHGQWTQRTAPELPANPVGQGHGNWQTQGQARPYLQPLGHGPPIELQ